MYLWIACAIVAVAGVVLAYWWVEPAPPDRVTIAAGPVGGAYDAAAKRYAEVFAANGVELDVIETAGSVENYERLLAGTADLAIVQGGTLPDGSPVGGLSSIAAIFHEPLLVFHRADLGEIDDLADLATLDVDAGPPGSGTRRLADALAADAGLRAFEGEGKDAILRVMSPDAPAARGLFADPNLRVMSLRRAEAVARRTPYLTAVTLPEGAVDLAANRPPRDVRLVAPAAVLVTRQDTHSAAVLLASMAAAEVHRGGTLLADAGDFPTDRHAELAVSDTAAHYFKDGPTFLRRSLPFWASSFVERATIVLLPLLALLIPLARVAPPVYRWRVRSRIYKWYAQLREIDATLSSDPAGQGARLDALEREVRDVTVPLSYMEEFYNLRLHMGYLRRRVREAEAP